MCTPLLVSRRLGVRSPESGQEWRPSGTAAVADDAATPRMGNTSRSPEGDKGLLPLGKRTQAFCRSSRQGARLPPTRRHVGSGVARLLSVAITVSLASRCLPPGGIAAGMTPRLSRAFDASCSSPPAPSAVTPGAARVAPAACNQTGGRGVLSPLLRQQQSSRGIYTGPKRHRLWARLECPTSLPRRARRVPESWM
jgi:hypothetical protein